MNRNKFNSILSAVVLVAGLAACGSKSNNNGYQNANDVYARCGNNQACIQQYMTQQYGPNSNGYQPQQYMYNGSQYNGYQVPYYQNGCNYGCGNQMYMSNGQGSFYYRGGW